MKKLLKLMLVGVFLASVGMTLTGCPDEVTTVEEDMTVLPDMAVQRDMANRG